MVNDYTYNALFHAIRAHFYFDLLRGFDNLLEGRPYASTLWRMLDSIKDRSNEYSGLTKKLDMPRLESIILPKHRKAVQTRLIKSILALRRCLYVNEPLHYLNHNTLPGSNKTDSDNTITLRASLIDYFTLDMDDYISGWAWLQNIASALAIDPYTVDICHLASNARSGDKCTWEKEKNLLTELEDWDCNGITLREMIYPDISIYPVDAILPPEKEVEKNDGSGKCRFEMLRGLVKDPSLRVPFISILTGVGSICYQQHLECIIRNELVSSNESNNDKIKYPVNLFRLTAGMENMLIVSDSNVINNYSVLVRCMKNPTEQNSDFVYFKPATVNVNDPETNTSANYLLRKVGPNEYIARQAEEGFIKAEPPLLVMHKDDPNLRKWAAVAIDGAQAAFDEATVLYLYTSSWNIMACTKRWLSGDIPDSVGFALEVSHDFVKWFIGAIYTKEFLNYANGAKLTSLNGVHFAAAGLKNSLKFGNIIGSVGLKGAMSAIGAGVSAYDAYKAAQDGDTGSAIAFWLDVALCSLAVVATRGTFLLVVGLGIGFKILGSALRSSKLEIELANCVYGKNAGKNDNALIEKMLDDNVFRLITVASPIHAEGMFINASKKYSIFATELDIPRLALNRYKLLKIYWPMFSQPFVKKRLLNYNTSMGQVSNITKEIKYIYLEDEQIMLLLSDNCQGDTYIWHDRGNGMELFVSFATEWQNDMLPNLPWVNNGR